MSNDFPSALKKAESFGARIEKIAKRIESRTSLSAYELREYIKNRLAIKIFSNQDNGLDNDYRKYPHLLTLPSIYMEMSNALGTIKKMNIYSLRSKIKKRRLVY
ncbi:MAG: hypothetical protein PHI79_08400 [Sulfurovaceae bacterium]|nr:hypothetical protein [Sulfurovaceae bacterium]MDD5549596.1 hypothetical protein [Sulfurovaceae bacterium]